MSGASWSPDYKSDRSAANAEIVERGIALNKMVNAELLKTIEPITAERDRYYGMLVKLMRAAGSPTVCATGDQDLLDATVEFMCGWLSDRATWKQP